MSKKRLIFSIYINFSHAGGDLNEYTPRHDLNLNVSLISYLHKKYAEKCNADYKIVGYGDLFHDLQNYLKQIEAHEGEYQSIQHFKFYLLEKFAKEYDEIVYFDLDVVPLTDENIFEAFDFNKGILMHGFHDDKPENVENIEQGWLTYVPMQRSCAVKYALMKALCKNRNIESKLTKVLNTGIMGFTSRLIQEMSYMKSLSWAAVDVWRIRRNGTNFYQQEIENFFNINNESVVSFLITMHALPFQDIGPEWHWVWNHRNKDEPVSDKAKIAHLINKQFNKFFNVEKVK